MTKNNIFFVENLNTKPLTSIDLARPVLLSVSPLKITTGSGSPVRPILILSGAFNNEILSPQNSAKSDLWFFDIGLLIVFLFSQIIWFLLKDQFLNEEIT